MTVDVTGGHGGPRFFLFYSVLCSGRHAVIKHAQDVTISLIKHAQNKYGEGVPSMKINYRNNR